MPVGELFRDPSQFRLHEYSVRCNEGPNLIYVFCEKMTAAGWTPWVLKAPSVALTSMRPPYNWGGGLYALSGFSKGDVVGLYGGVVEKLEGRRNLTHAIQYREVGGGGDLVVNAVDNNPPPFLGAMNASNNTGARANVILKASLKAEVATKIPGLSQDGTTFSDICMLPLQDLQSSEMITSYGKDFDNTVVNQSTKNIIISPYTADTPILRFVMAENLNQPPVIIAPPEEAPIVAEQKCIEKYGGRCAEVYLIPGSVPVSRPMFEAALMAVKNGGSLRVVSHQIQTTTIPRRLASLSDEGGASKRRCYMGGGMHLDSREIRNVGEEGVYDPVEIYGLMRRASSVSTTLGKQVVRNADGPRCYVEGVEAESCTVLGLPVENALIRVCE